MRSDEGQFARCLGTWLCRRAIATSAFAEGCDEVVAVERVANTRAAATARRLGVEWLGVTEKYYGLRLQVFRLRPTDLDESPYANRNR
jgi:hypothetical protein